MTVKLQLWMRWLLFIITIIVLLGGCRVVESVPNADIMFQTMAKDMGSPYSLGFINDDGTGLEYIKLHSLPGGMPMVPVQTFNAEYLVLLGQHTDSASTLGLVSAITKDGRLKKHDFYAKRVAPVPNKQQVIMEHYDDGKSKNFLSSLYLLDLEMDTVVEAYHFADKDNRETGIGANAISGSNLVFARYSEQSPPEIVLLDTKSGAEKVVLIENAVVDGYGPSLFYPSISPDGRWIAYAAEGGIYIIGSEGEGKKRVIDTCIAREYITGYLKADSWPPAPSWSPDSRWIVYHRCTLPCPQYCKNIDDYDIFKLNIETGKEVLLVKGGLNPYWQLSPRTKN